jgi:hypothetical protein
MSHGLETLLMPKLKIKDTLRIRQFIEKTDEDYHKYNTIWKNNSHRMVYLDLENDYNNENLHRPMFHDGNEKNDILAIRWDTEEKLKNNMRIEQLKKKGFIFCYSPELGTKFKPVTRYFKWTPTEIWIYD